jgi:site-specific DNA-methyltransferase (cytosine-N4-specific)
MTLFANQVLVDQNDWTFRDAETRYFTHCYHDYPARMIPQIAHKLISTYYPDAEIMFDPYCGTGTTLVEGILHGVQTIGTDINPLARLIAEAKTTKYDEKELDKQLRRFLEFLMSPSSVALELPPWMDETRVSFWFKPDVTRKLRKIYSFISHIESTDIEKFFLVAFSETIRESSNTKSGEFKLVRRSKDVLERHNPDPFEIMLSKLGRNRQGFGELSGFMGDAAWPHTQVENFNTVEEIPSSVIPESCVDIVITSPPYGDSHTTVAYGQYSRLSSDWLGFEEAPQVDRNLMGGRRASSVPKFGISSLDSAIEQVEKSSSERAREVASFYNDLQASIGNVSKVINKYGYVCYVVANRKVKGVTLPTDDAVQGFFAQNGFTHIETHYRHIPNKRMPAKNSPNNITGETDTTMHTESIVVMRREF